MTRVRDIPYSISVTWPSLAADPDMDGLDPDWTVVLGEVSTDEDSGWHDEGQVEEYRKMFQSNAPVAPVVMVDDYLVTGAHRLAGAYRAGLLRIPAYFVEVPNVD